MAAARWVSPRLSAMAMSRSRARPWPVSARAETAAPRTRAAGASSMPSRRSVAASVPICPMAAMAASATPARRSVASLPSAPSERSVPTKPSRSHRIAICWVERARARSRRMASSSSPTMWAGILSCRRVAAREPVTGRGPLPPPATKGELPGPPPPRSAKNRAIPAMPAVAIFQRAIEVIGRSPRAVGGETNAGGAGSNSAAPAHRPD